MSNEPPNKKTKTEIITYDGDPFELKCINTIRALSADLPQAANSGHPGAAMGCAPMAHVLWSEVMNYSPSQPKWWNRDRFILSNGHMCALLYSMLHLSGYPLTIDDLKKFRRFGSKTPGHPESFETDGVEVCTGPLGQGISNAVGIAMAEKHMEATYNQPDFPIFNHFTYVICGDGCLQEGVSSETSSLAGHLGLGKLIVLYDDNHITIDGSTDLSFTEDVTARYDAYGWHTQTVGDVASAKGVNDMRQAIQNAQAETGKPSIIKIRTSIGYGCRKEGTAAVHGAPLGEEILAETKVKYGLDPKLKFHVDDNVQELFSQRTTACEATREKWDALYKQYVTAYPEKAAELERRFSHTFLDDTFQHLPTFEFGKTKAEASRKYSNYCLNGLAPVLPELIGGSADLSPSNLTQLKCSGDFQKDTPAGRYLRFGVREHGMAAICNGLFAYGCFRPFCATFLVFSGYAMGSIRLSALSKFGVLYIMTHDSIGLGEDGPTHQPVETLECLRSIPNLNVFRPSDGNEMRAAYKTALTTVETPTIICGSRSTIKGSPTHSDTKAELGAYVIVEEASPDLILVATGSEVPLCVDAAKILSGEGVKTRMVSMPCQEIFYQQSSSYQLEVLPGNAPTLSVEASLEIGWHKISHAQIGMKGFGKSGSGSDCFEHFGFTVENVVEKGKKLVQFYKDNGPVPNLCNRPNF